MDSPTTFVRFAARHLAQEWSSANLSEVSFPSGPRDVIYASRRRACVRAMALDLMHPEDDVINDAEAIERLRRGRDAERLSVSRLMTIGGSADPAFEVVGGQDSFVLRDRDGVALISGRIDGRLWFPKEKQRVVFEVKSGRSYEDAESIEDLDRGVWTAHAVDQLLAYLLGHGEPAGLFIIIRGGVPRFIPVVLEEHLDRAETFLRDARAAIDARFERAEMPAFTDRKALCSRCPHYGKSCVPPAGFGDGVAVIDNPALEDAAAMYAETKAAAEANAAAWKALTRELRGIERGVLGRFAVSGRWSSSTRYEIPDEVKQSYRVTDPRGRFSLTVERMPEA